MFRVYQFTTSSGRQPVDEFINKQSEATQTKIDEVIHYFKQHGFHLETNFLRRMSGTKDLWELRAEHQSKHYRLFLAKIDDRAAVLLHAFIKKTPKTPRKELQTAEKRLRQLAISLL